VAPFVKPRDERDLTNTGETMPDTALPLTEQLIAARLERLPYSRWHITVSAFLGVAIFFDSFDSLAIAYVLPVLREQWHIPPQSIGGLLSIANLGQALGAFIFGWAAERIGRVSAARLTIALYAAMSLACAFTQNYDQLFWCRFVEGIGLGGEIPVASTYISEILRAERRGGSFLAYQMIFPVGLLGAGIAGASVVPNLGWQWMFIIGAVPAIISLFLRRYCPESPRWLASKGRLAEADTIVTEIERIVSRNGTVPLPPVKALAPPPVAQKTRWQELFQGRYRARTLLVWVLWASSYIISYGMQGWVPTLFREVYHLPVQQALYYAIAAPAGSVIGSIICALLIDRTGRRYWFIAAYLLIAAGLIALWAIGADTALGFLLGYGFC
jgi:putative MFS transporter